MGNAAQQEPLFVPFQNKKSTEEGNFAPAMLKAISGLLLSICLLSYLSNGYEEKRRAAIASHACMADITTSTKSTPPDHK